MNYTEKCRWLADFYAKAVDEGREMQFRRATEWESTTMGPCMDSDPDQWRLKPAPPTAWVVWDDEYARGLFVEPDEAVRVRKFINGIIQKITRPTIDNDEGRGE